MDSSEPYTRRTMLKGTAGAVGLAGVGATSGTALGQDDVYDGWLSDDDTFEGVTHDAREVDDLVVAVGAQGNEGPNAFDPSAILVEPETTVRWEWTGDGFHDVTHIDRDWASEGTAEEGFEFEHTFADEGVHKYVCTPHEGVGMMGVVVVGEDNVETELVEWGLGEDGLNTSAIWAGAAVFGGVSVLGVAAYRELVDDSQK